ncbi:hypothetical protein LOZ58_001072 [Ophidiomyces ophidiicola]|nr:hypothetical protein LOZ65_001395 [Ophidiomyces ophidiicola]KAI1937309.1 hypothetical protein LOZ66_004227 [Ophidiomyces ophidiicola]KAI1965226.1 hypothetical protein LOZ58_001072 [Ophidiomyces ophidiicola]
MASWIKIDNLPNPPVSNERAPLRNDPEAQKIPLDSPSTLSFWLPVRTTQYQDAQKEKASSATSSDDEAKNTDFITSKNRNIFPARSVSPYAVRVPKESGYPGSLDIPSTVGSVKGNITKKDISEMAPGTGAPKDEKLLN